MKIQWPDRDRAVTESRGASGLGAGGTAGVPLASLLGGCGEIRVPARAQMASAFRISWPDREAKRISFRLKRKMKFRFNLFRGEFVKIERWDEAGRFVRTQRWEGTPGPAPPDTGELPSHSLTSPSVRW